MSSTKKMLAKGKQYVKEVFGGVDTKRFRKQVKLSENLIRGYVDMLMNDPELEWFPLYTKSHTEAECLAELKEIFIDRGLDTESILKVYQRIVADPYTQMMTKSVRASGESEKAVGKYTIYLVQSRNLCIYAGYCDSVAVWEGLTQLGIKWYMPSQEARNAYDSLEFEMDVEYWLKKLNFSHGSKHIRMEYNGWSNWETWNLMLWFGDNKAGMQSVYRTYKGTTITAETAKAIMSEMYPSGTPDMKVGQMGAVDWSEVATALNDDIESGSYNFARRSGNMVRAESIFTEEAYAEIVRVLEQNETRIIRARYPASEASNILCNENGINYSVAKWGFTRWMDSYRLDDGTEGLLYNPNNFSTGTDKAKLSKAPAKIQLGGQYPYHIFELSGDVHTYARGNANDYSEATARKLYESALGKNITRIERNYEEYGAVTYIVTTNTGGRVGITFEGTPNIPKVGYSRSGNGVRMSYNGWSNWDTWTVSMYLRADEPVYRFYLQLIKNTRIDKYTAKGIALECKSHSSDGYSWDKVNIEAVNWSEIASMMIEDKG